MTLRYRTTSAPCGQKCSRILSNRFTARFACTLHGAVGRFASPRVAREHSNRIVNGQRKPPCSQRNFMGTRVEAAEKHGAHTTETLRKGSRTEGKASSLAGASASPDEAAAFSASSFWRSFSGSLTWMWMSRNWVGSAAREGVGQVGIQRGEGRGDTRTACFAVRGGKSSPVHTYFVAGEDWEEELSFLAKRRHNS